MYWECEGIMLLMSFPGVASFFFGLNIPLPPPHQKYVNLPLNWKVRVFEF